MYKNLNYKRGTKRYYLYFKEELLICSFDAFPIFSLKKKKNIFTAFSNNNFPSEVYFLKPYLN